MQVRVKIERMKGLRKLIWETFKEKYELYFALHIT